MYRYRLEIQGVQFYVSPTNSSIVLKDNRVEGFLFTRKELDKITLSGRDYELVVGADITYEFSFIVEEYLDGTWSEVVRGKFNKTDCEIDENSKTLTFTPITVDRYTNFLENLDVEYDFLKYSPSFSNVNYVQNAILQIYAHGASKVTNIIGDRSWVQECTPVYNSSTLRTDYNFGFSTKAKAFIQGVGAGVVPDVTGEYELVYREFDVIEGGTSVWADTASGQYQIISYGIPFDPEYSGIIGSDLADPLEYGYIGLTIPSGTLDDMDDFNSLWRDKAVPSRQYRFIGIDPDSGIYCFKARAGTPVSSSGTLEHVSGATNTADQAWTVYTNPVGGGELDNLYFRYAIIDTLDSDSYKFIGVTNEKLNDNPTYQKGTIFSEIGGSDQVRLTTAVFSARVIYNENIGIPTNVPFSDPTDQKEIPEEDIVSPNDNYTLCAPINIDAAQFVVADDHSVSDLGLGLVSSDALYFNGDYFAEPVTGNDLIPLLLGDWTETSWWFYHNVDTDQIFANPYTLTLRHGYKLSEVTKILLSQIDSNVSYDETTTNSDFFFGNSNPIRSSQRDVFITPKSNVIETNYNRPATKSKLKMRELIEMYKTLYNAYVDIDENNNFVIEFVDFYRNGRTYSGQNLGVDLSLIKTTRRDGNITDFSSQYSYDSPPPRRMKWNYMDEQSSEFEGGDMVAQDTFVAEAGVSEMSLNLFSADIDYIISNPEEIAKDGFVIMEANYNGVDYDVAFAIQDSLNIQNGYLTIPYIQSTYFTHDAIAQRLLIGANVVTASSIKRRKVQEMTLSDTRGLDTKLLITTNLGSGIARTKETDLVNGSVKISIEHDTEL